MIMSKQFAFSKFQSINPLLPRHHLGSIPLPFGPPHHHPPAVEPETGGGFYEYSLLLCLLVTALSFTTIAGSDKLKALARVGVFSTAITQFNWVNCWKHNILQQKCILFGIIDIFARQILCVELSPHVKYNSRCHFICYQQACPLIFLPTV